MACLNPKILNWRQHPTTGCWAPDFHSPLPVTRENYKYAVPCNDCVHCVMTRIKGYIFRCFFEKKMWAFSYCVTLTYNDKYHLNNDRLLNYTHVQKFLKRLRKTGYKIKYYVCGEYGARRKLPHWHIILYTDKPFLDLHLKEKKGDKYNNGSKAKVNQYFSPLIHKLWYVDEKNENHSHRVGILDIKSVAYVVGYQSKKLLEKQNIKKNLPPTYTCWRNKVYDEKKTVIKILPFNRQSQNLGIFALDQLRPSQLICKEPVYIEGRPYFTPKYYRKKLGLIFSKEDQQQKEIPFFRGTLKNHLLSGRIFSQLKTNKKIINTRLTL